MRVESCNSFAILQ